MSAVFFITDGSGVGGDNAELARSVKCVVTGPRSQPAARWARTSGEARLEREEKQRVSRPVGVSGSLARLRRHLCLISLLRKPKRQTIEDSAAAGHRSFTPTYGRSSAPRAPQPNATSGIRMEFHSTAAMGLTPAAVTGATVTLVLGGMVEDVLQRGGAVQPSGGRMASFGNPLALRCASSQCRPSKKRLGFRLGPSMPSIQRALTVILSGCERGT
jgi:hypothetical protein